MNPYKKNLFLIVGLFCLTLIFTNTVNAQDILYNYNYKLDLTGATEAPKLGGMPNIQIPKEATKNGVEGTLKSVRTLAADGTVKDINFMQTLPHGVEEAVINAYKTFRFQPAKRNGNPVDVKLYLPANAINRTSQMR